MSQWILEFKLYYDLHFAFGRWLAKKKIEKVSGIPRCRHPRQMDEQFEKLDPTSSLRSGAPVAGWNQLSSVYQIAMFKRRFITSWTHTLYSNCKLFPKHPPKIELHLHSMQHTLSPKKIQKGVYRPYIDQIAQQKSTWRWRFLSCRPTIISCGKSWAKRSQPSLLSAKKTEKLETDQQKKALKTERNLRAMRVGKR